MLETFAAHLRLALNLAIIVVNTIVHATPLLLLAVVKLLIPIRPVRNAISKVLVLLAESWIWVNSTFVTFVAGLSVQTEGLQGLKRDGWYLVICNHQSWADIPVLQKVFNRRIPFLKFFLKRELIWVPVLGLAWWALDFPFMNRYSKELLKKHPELRGKDTEATRKACEKYRHLPVSVMNFVEGTRFTEAKHSRRSSPYEHLLVPRSGGIALVLDAMGSMLNAVVDVTLVYPNGRPGMIDLLSGRARAVKVLVDVIPIPQELLGGDYENDKDFRVRFQAWLNARWSIKDQIISKASCVAE